MTRRILIITAGESPQVITETLHALAKPTKGQPWWPDELVLMTTRRGGDLYNNGDPAKGLSPLLGGSGRLARLIVNLARPTPIIRTVIARHRSGAYVDDIRTEAEVSAFADTLLDEVRNASQGDSEIHLSLAGGRKTMSYLAGAVLSIYGRSADRLSHVLVEPKMLERVPEFWWPGQTDPASGLDKDKNPWSAETARTLLHTVPFIRYRAYLPNDEVFSRGGLSFAEAVARANDALAAKWLVVDTESMAISAGNSRVIIAEPAQFAVYRFLAQARREMWSFPRHPPGAVWLDNIPFGRTAAGDRLMDVLSEIHKDVWIRGRKVDDLRAQQENDEFKSPSPRAGRPTPTAPPSQAEAKKAFKGRIGPQISDLRNAVMATMPPVLAKQVAPANVKRGYWTIYWDPNQIDIR